MAYEYYPLEDPIDCGCTGVLVYDPELYQESDYNIKDASGVFPPTYVEDSICSTSSDGGYTVDGQSFHVITYYSGTVVGEPANYVYWKQRYYVYRCKTECPAGQYRNSDGVCICTFPTEINEDGECIYPDYDCEEEDKPFPTITDPDCAYTSAWKDDDPNAHENKYNCMFENGWKPTGWTRLTDGTCHDTYDYTTGDIAHALIDCEGWSACKKCTYHTWDNNGNPNIPACWNWTPGDPISGHKIYIPEQVETEHKNPATDEPQYSYVTPDFPTFPGFPPFPDFPPFYPPPPGEPIIWNGWPPYDPDSEDFSTFEWCDCNIKDTVSNNCGCFEKPVKNSGLSCSGYVPKKYKKWVAYFCYNNSEDTL